MPDGDLKKHILIITAYVGCDHRSSANVVTAALIERFGDQCLVDVVIRRDDKRTPAYL